MTNILVIEDEPRIASFVVKGLGAAGYATTLAEDGDTGLLLARSGAFDLVLLDLGLPGTDGAELLRRLRGEGHTLPVIIVTARDSVQDTVAGLDGGANDYLTKPFRFEELLARVRVRLRDGGPASPGVDGTLLQVGGVTLDLRSRRLTTPEGDADLTAREFALMETFLRHPGQVLSREQLLDRAWGIDFDPSSNVVDVFVRALRAKVGRERVETVRGAGYRLRTD